MYYVTFSIRFGKLSDDEIKMVLSHIVDRHNTFYHLFAAQVMPDHVHIIQKPFPKYSLSRIMKGLKGVSAKKINVFRKTMGSIWQDESYDRIIRSEKDLSEKIKYIYENPLRAKIVKDPDSYCGWYFQENSLRKGDS